MNDFFDNIENEELVGIHEDNKKFVPYCRFCVFPTIFNDSLWIKDTRFIQKIIKRNIDATNNQNIKAEISVIKTNSVSKEPFMEISVMGSFENIRNILEFINALQYITQFPDDIFFAMGFVLENNFNGWEINDKNLKFEGYTFEAFRSSSIKEGNIFSSNSHSQIKFCFDVVSQLCPQLSKKEIFYEIVSYFFNTKKNNVLSSILRSATIKHLYQISSYEIKDNDAETREATQKYKDILKLINGRLAKDGIYKLLSGQIQKEVDVTISVVNIFETGSVFPVKIIGNNFWDGANTSDAPKKETKRFQARSIVAPDTITKDILYQKETSEHFYLPPFEIPLNKDKYGNLEPQVSYIMQSVLDNYSKICNHKRIQSETENLLLLQYDPVLDIYSIAFVLGYYKDTKTKQMYIVVIGLCGHIEEIQKVINTIVC